MPRAAVAGTELYVERRGDGEPLLLVQGLGANCTHWGEPFLAALERDFELVLYDHRGTGRSAPLDGDVTTASMAADAVALLDALEIERAHVLGISMGGMVAQELALAVPERVRTLTLGCTSCGGTQSRATDQDVVSAVMAAALSRDMQLLLRTGFGYVVSPAYAAVAANFAAFTAAATAYPPSLAVLMAHHKAVLGHDTYARLRGLRVPALVIHGGADQLLAAVNGDLLASLIPGARYEQLDGVGHLFFWEQPERAAQLVREHARSDR